MDVQTARRRVATHLEGATFAPLPEDYDRRGVESGVYVESVARGSPAWQNELRSEDVITSVNRRRIPSLDDFRRIVSASTELLFSVRRGQRAFFLPLR